MPVYLIRAGALPIVKVGKANDPGQRLADLQTGHWETLKLLRVWQGGLAEEASLHARFADLRIKGDWFALSRLMLGDVGLVEMDLGPFTASALGSIRKPEKYDSGLTLAIQTAGGAGRCVGDRAIRDHPMAAGACRTCPRGCRLHEGSSGNAAA